MLRLKCKDMGARCRFVAKGGNAALVKKRMWEHATKKHSRMLGKMTPAKRKRMNALMTRLLMKNKTKKRR